MERNLVIDTLAMQPMVWKISPSGFGGIWEQLVKKLQKIHDCNPGKQTVDVASPNNHRVSRRTDVTLENVDTRQQ